MKHETMEEHHARLQERYQELCRELASTNLSVTTLENWASAINERAAVSQMLFRLDLLMTKGALDMANVVINEEPAADDEWVEPEWITTLRPQPEPQPVPEWLQLFPAPTDVLTQWAGEEVRP